MHIDRIKHSIFLAFTYHCAGGRLSRPVPTVLGVRPRRLDVPLRHGDTLLEKLRQDHREGCARLPNRSLVSKRVHRRVQEISSRANTTAIPQALDGTAAILYHFRHRHITPGPCSCDLDYAFPTPYHHAQRSAISDPALLLDQYHYPMGGRRHGVGHCGHSAWRSVLVDLVVGEAG